MVKNKLKDFKTLNVRAGFTLIEIMTSIFIIGLILLLVVPNVSKIKEVANENQAEAMVHTVQAQADMYASEHPDDVTYNIFNLEQSGYLSAAQYQRCITLKISVDAQGKAYVRKS